MKKTLLILLSCFLLSTTGISAQQVECWITTEGSGMHFSTGEVYHVPPPPHHHHHGKYHKKHKHHKKHYKHYKKHKKHHKKHHHDRPRGWGCH